MEAYDIYDPDIQKVILFLSWNIYFRLLYSDPNFLYSDHHLSDLNDLIDIPIKMNYFLKIILKIKYTCFFLAGFLITGCYDTGEAFKSGQSGNNAEETRQNIIPAGIPEGIAVSPPPFSDGIFPCNDCHTFQKPNPVRRQLVEWHDDIIFNHDSENRWCLDCHDLNQRDSLRLASGKLLDFKESYKLCGQCHGEKYRDWKVGVHGKRTGEWNGTKEYLLCVHCHNPHSPKFQELKPEPPPVRQEEIK